MSLKLSFTALLLAVICAHGALANEEAVWIDVRTSLEHSVDNIEGDSRIPHGDIIEGVTALYPDKETKIYLYCRSGGWSEKAADALRQAGYTNVTNVGGIDDARTARGLTE